VTTALQSGLTAVPAWGGTVYSRFLYMAVGSKTRTKTVTKRVLSGGGGGGGGGGSASASQATGGFSAGSMGSNAPFYGVDLTGLSTPASRAENIIGWDTSRDSASQGGAQGAAGAAGAAGPVGNNGGGNGGVPTPQNGYYPIANSTSTTDLSVGREGFRIFMQDITTTVVEEYFDRVTPSSGAASSVGAST
jgi:hypothetical protein